MVELLRHRQTKEAATDMFNLQPPRHISTLPKTDFAPPQHHFRCTSNIGHCRQDPYGQSERYRTAKSHKPNQVSETRAGCGISALLPDDRASMRRHQFQANARKIQAPALARPQLPFATCFH